MEATYFSLEIKQKALHESKLYMYKLQNDLNVPHLSSCMEGNLLGMVEELHVEDEHEESSALQVLVKGDDMEYLVQTLIVLHKYIQEDIPFRSTRKYTYLH